MNKTQKILKLSRHVYGNYFLKPRVGVCIGPGLDRTGPAWTEDRSRGRVWTEDRTGPWSVLDRTGLNRSRTGLLQLHARDLARFDRTTKHGRAPSVFWTRANRVNTHDRAVRAWCLCLFFVTFGQAIRPQLEVLSIQHNHTCYLNKAIQSWKTQVTQHSNAIHIST